MKNFQLLKLKFKKTYNTSIIGLTALLFISLFMGITSAVYAEDVTLAWDANESQPDGYRVYVRAEDESYDYTMPAWTGIDTTTTLNNLTDGTTYYFVVRAYIGSIESDNSNELTYTAGNNGEDDQSNRIIIDNEDEGATSTGSWHTSNGSDPYGDQSLYSLQQGSTYSYTAELSGSHEVSLWWSGFSNRCDNVAVEIYDGETLLNTVYVNQQNDSGQWYSLGNYDFTDTALIKIAAGLKQNGNRCSTCADAVSFSED